MTSLAFTFGRRDALLAECLRRRLRIPSCNNYACSETASPMARLEESQPPAVRSHNLHVLNASNLLLIMMPELHLRPADTRFRRRQNNSRVA